MGPALSTDPKYGGLDPADVPLTNNDNDTAGITVTPTAGLVTTEAGAHTTAFDPASETLYVFLPHTHRAAVYRDHP